MCNSFQFILNCRRNKKKIVQNTHKEERKLDKIEERQLQSNQIREEEKEATKIRKQDRRNHQECNQFTSNGQESQLSTETLFIQMKSMNLSM